MNKKNLHTAKLFPYILHAPASIQRKFYNFHSEESLNKFYNQYGNCSFMGLLFYDNKVFCYNIQIYSINSDETRYLEITKLFNELLKEYNIFHLCYLFHRALFKYYREDCLTENILPYIQFQSDPKLKPKFNYAVTKHRGRYRLFTESKRNENYGEWYSLLLRSISKDSASKLLRQYLNQRPCLFDSVYKALPKINTVTYESESSKNLRKSIKKRRKKVGKSIQKRRSIRRNNTNFKLK